MEKTISFNESVLQDLNIFIEICEENKNNMSQNLRLNNGKDVHQYQFYNLVEPIIFDMLTKYKFEYTDRKYLIYYDKAEEAKVKPLNHILNKDNKEASLWWRINNLCYLVVYSKHIINKECCEHKIPPFDKLQAFILELKVIYEELINNKGEDS